jgi:hypothetical protein
MPKKVFPHLPKIEVSREEAAYMLSVSTDTLDLIPGDELPRIPFGPAGKQLRIRVADLEAYSRRRAEQARKAG